MQLISAFKVEQDLQLAWREEREREIHPAIEYNRERDREGNRNKLRCRLNANPAR
jgi:hypothetical protein